MTTTISKELANDLTTMVFGVLCGLPANESPLDVNVHARFVHRLIAHVVRTALQEEPMFEELLLARVLWSFPDVPLRYDDFEFVLRHLQKRGLIEFADGQYSLVETEAE